MSNPGKHPNVVSMLFTPQAVTPTNPREGDIFYSDGTSRALGLWSYTASAWAQISTGSTLSTLDKLTLTPQAADPGTPAEGMLFMSDGTARAEGLWLYQDSVWVQLTGIHYEEYYHKNYITARAASTANVTLASQCENGDSFGGVTLATNDIILLKNQTTTTENGVYVVSLSGAPTRHADASDATELTRCAVYVSAGTNIKTRWFQQNTLTALSDAQSWAATPAAFTITVPSGKYEADVEMCGGGGGGGGGSWGASGIGGGGGAGGAGAIAQRYRVKVTPGGTLTGVVGLGGLGGNGGSSGAGAAGVDGTDSTLHSGATLLALAPGANSGAGGNASASDSSAGTTYVKSMGLFPSPGGNGAGGETGSGAAGGYSPYSETNATGGSASVSASNGGGGGGGGASYGPGTNGGTAGSGNGTALVFGTQNRGVGGGGGGGGGLTGAPNSGGAGGNGGDGYLKISWI